MRGPIPPFVQRDELLCSSARAEQNRYSRIMFASCWHGEYDSYFQLLPGKTPLMLVTEKGQVTIPKHIRTAAGVLPGSEVSFSLEGSKIIITPVATAVRNDRRAKLREAAARVRSSLSPEFKQLGADEIMDFLRGDSEPNIRPRRGRG